MCEKPSTHNNELETGASAALKHHGLACSTGTFPEGIMQQANVTRCGWIRLKKRLRTAPGPASLWQGRCTNLLALPCARNLVHDIQRAWNWCLRSAETPWPDVLSRHLSRGDFAASQWHPLRLNPLKKETKNSAWTCFLYGRADALTCLLFHARET